MDKPFITIGILGTVAEADLIYNVNTYIAQNYDCYELIFALDKKQCVEISDIINVVNAQQYDFEGKIKIIEEDFTNPLYGCLKKVVLETRGEYVIFLSMEDAFYENSVLSKIDSCIKNNKKDVYLFRTAVRIDTGQEVIWQSYYDVHGNNMSLAACYSKKIILEVLDYCSQTVDTVAELQKEIFSICDRRGLTKSIELIDITMLVHFTKVMQSGIFDYYVSAYKNMAMLNYNGSSVAADGMNRSDLKKLYRFITQYKSSHNKKNTVFLTSVQKEYDYIIRLTNKSIWGLSNSQKQYLNLLMYLAGNSLNTFSYIAMKYKVKRAINARKLKLLFLANEYSVWPSFKSIYDTACISSNLEVQLVYVPFYHEFSNIDHDKEMEFYRNKGYCIIPCTDYNLAQESPDIVFYIKPYDSVPEKYQIKEVRKLVNTIVYVPYGMEIGNTKECLRYQCFSNMQYYASFILAYAPDYYHKMKKYTFHGGDNYLTIGHPRIDLKNNVSQKHSLLNKIKKAAENKIIVLWNTHFTLQAGDNWGTFLQYGETILNYFYNHQDIFLLWRPHPLFYKSLADIKGVSVEEIILWIQEITNKNNILVDKSSDYLPSFAVSDVMISDWASFVPEYFSYGKRFLITQKQNCTTSLLAEAEKVFEIAGNNIQITEFLEDVRLNKLISIDEEIIKKYLYLPQNGTVANTLLDILLEL